MDDFIRLSVRVRVVIMKRLTEKHCPPSKIQSRSWQVSKELEENPEDVEGSANISVILFRVSTKEQGKQRQYATNTVL